MMKMASSVRLGTGGERMKRYVICVWKPKIFEAGLVIVD